MRSVYFLIMLAFGGCARQPVSEPSTSLEEVQSLNEAAETSEAPASATTEPSVVPIGREELSREVARMAELKTPPSFYDAVATMVEEGKVRYKNRPWVIATAGTDSQNGGLDNWRSCAKFKPEQMGFKADDLVLFVDENEQPCATSPNGYVAMIAFAVPDNQAPKLQLKPTYKSEQMTIMIGYSTFVPANDGASH